MAEKAKVFDVWIMETNTVYQKVPFTVVTDWVQQGRLLGEDQLRYSGTEKWIRIDAVSAFAAYLPKVEAYRVEDKAEALEPVQVDFAWKPRVGDDDDDVDMIPLIDISLVLLIFFMMTAAVATGAMSPIKTPEAEFKLLTIDPEMVWIGIDKDQNGQPVYSLGKGEQGEGESFASRQQLVDGLGKLLAAQENAVNIRIRAHARLPNSEVEETMGALEKFKSPRGKIANIFAEVREKESK